MIAVLNRFLLSPKFIPKQKYLYAVVYLAVFTIPSRKEKTTF